MPSPLDSDPSFPRFERFVPAQSGRTDWLFGREVFMTRLMVRRSCVALLFLLLWCPFLPSASSQTAVEADQIQLEPVVSGLSNPVFVTDAHDGTNRLFIVEQDGRLKVLQPGSDTAQVFLDLTSKVLFGGERGLLGLAFHPDFKNNRRFFVDYTRQPDGATIIAEYRVSQANPNVADATETILLMIPQPFPNHNGGMVTFGPDGFLYIGMGDGGSSNDPGNRAQDINNLLGKILRIDVDHSNGAVPYSSPASNPFVGRAGLDEIFAFGLRNPWRFSFDRLTGDLYVADVGQNTWEEIDVVTAGANYGWRIAEGNHCNQAIGGGVCSMAGFIPPIAEYGHTGGRCSITGGYVYRGSKGTFLSGTYLYADYCSGEIFTLATGGGQSLLLDSGMNISSFGEDESGEIYVVGLGGTIQRFVNSNPPPPSTLTISSAVVRRRSTQEVLQPITVRANGKKFEVVLFGQGFVADSVVLLNGRELKSDLQQTETEASILVGRLRGFTLSEPTTLTIEFVNPGGAHSNQVMLRVVP